MKNLHLLAIGIYFLVYEVNYAQNCGNTESYAASRSSACDSWEDYEPSSHNNTPIKTIRITFHIFRDGSQGLQNNSSTRAFIDDIVSLINYFWYSTQVYNGSATTTYYQDCRLRVQNVNKYFWNDAGGWMYQHTSTSHKNYVWNYIQDQSIVAYKTTSLHIVSGNYNNSLAGWAPAVAGGNDQIIFAPDFDDKYIDWLNGDPDGAGSLAALLRHEIGHTLNLFHPDEDYGCSDYDHELYGTNNIMGYQGGSTSISLCQIHRMHAAIWNNYQGIKDYVVSGAGSGDQKTPTVVGPSCLSTSAGIFFISNYPFGALPDWTASPSSKVTTSSGCGNEAIFASNNSSNTGSGSIIFNLKYGSTTKSKTTPFVFSNGITGTVTSGGSTYPFYGGGNFVDGTSVTAAIQAPGATSFTWTKTGGSGSWYTYNSGKNLSLTLSTGGDISFNIVTTNSTCGTLSTSCYFVHIGGYYAFYPNPTTGDLFVEITKDEIEIDVPDDKGQVKKEKIKFGLDKRSQFDKNGNLLKEQKLVNGSQKGTISLDGLQPDVYIVIAKDGDRLIESKIIKN
ncbi:MAG: hypothetical protein IPL46_30475 [Saprospiraceae bacterium]|nr:hypothetical protein [Saprospiraceae bacterium]